jgi:hypothetical protein
MCIYTVSSWIFVGHEIMSTAPQVWKDGAGSKRLRNRVASCYECELRMNDKKS